MSTVPEPCPAMYLEHRGACYRFGGTHISYDGATTFCEQQDARLADVSGTNSDYLKQQLKKLGGNDYWIGTYVVGGRTERRGTSQMCPMFRRQSAGANSGHYGKITCNSAYPYICQKYGQTPSNRPTNEAGDGQTNLQRPSRFGFSDREVEIPSTTSRSLTASSTTEAPGSSNQVLYALLSVGVLIALAILIWQYRKRKRRQKAKLNDTEKTAKVIPSGPSSGISVGAASNTKSSTIHRQLYLPSNITTMTSEGSSLIRQKGSNKRDVFPKDKPNVCADMNGHVNSAFKVYDQDPGPYREHYQLRSKSLERNGRYDSEFEQNGESHGPPSRRQRCPRENRGQITGKSRRRRSCTEAEESLYSDSSSDSTNSRSSFRRSVHRASGRRGRSRYHSDRHRRSSTRHTRPYEHVSRASSRRSRSEYEKYAACMPPPPARGRGNGEMGQSPPNYGYQGYFNGGGYSSYGGRPSAADAHYFAHITNAMDINTHDTTPSKKEIHHVRLPRQGPIRVNRHIHDWEDKQQTVNKRISNDSDHIYESLDEVARNRMKLAKTRAPSRSPAATRHILSRDETNGSTGSRASMRGRELPAIPI